MRELPCPQSSDFVKGFSDVFGVVLTRQYIRQYFNEF